MADEREQLAPEELESEQAEPLEDRETMSIGGFGDGIVDFNYDHPYLGPELDGYEAPQEQGGGGGGGGGGGLISTDDPPPGV